ncbi:MAG: energy-coupling factor transporter ATPase [Lachnospiraceae bacterium]|nr:energy-coupling factor transporter ATPase [Lachnospiraceae bacterium]
MGIVVAKDLAFEYIRRDEEGNVEGITRAIDGVTLNIKAGEFVAVLGGNGSGKSTFAKHINALLYPTEGNVYVDGKDTAAAENTWDIRQTAGMIFQNPDNQIIGNIVEEDVGFGPENMGVPTDEIWQRVEEALQVVGMKKYAKHSPNKLSGGQKQRVAIAGVVAMHPKCIIMDEPTAMLDPEGRYEVIRAARALNSVEKVTVILITHYMEEVINASRVVVMDHGKVVMMGTPREIFSNVDQLRELRLDVPQVTTLGWYLRKDGLPIKKGILSVKELSDALLEIKKSNFTLPDSALMNARKELLEENNRRENRSRAEDKPLLILDHISYVYSAGSNEEIKALDDVSFTIKKGEFIGLIGHTGSGKSTLVQHLNGLNKATSGTVYFKGEDIYEKGYDMRKLRSKVGLVFQYPEHQLFEETVFKDVCFGPLNMGLSKKDAELAAFDALRAVRFPEEYFYSSPFELSGGQKRRIAIAGVIAMKPEILVLDEPTAGLDPKGRDEILGLIKDLHEKQNITVVLVSHSMEDVANYAERIVAVDNGKIIMDGSPREVFKHYKELEKVGLAAPQVTYIMNELKDKGFNLDTNVTTIAEARYLILSEFNS